MSSNDPFGDLTKDIAEGTAKGILNWTKEQISEFVSKIKNRDIAFIGDKRTIDTIRDLLKTGEWDLYNRYLVDKNLRLLVQMGLTLRKLEGEPIRLQILRDKIVRKFGANSLHIAQFVQNGFLSKYFGSMVEKSISHNEITTLVEEILNNTYKYTIFIKEIDNPNKVAEDVRIRIQANLPNTFILSSYTSAITVAKKVVRIIRDSMPEYSIEFYEDNKKFLCIFSRTLNLH